MVLPGTWNEDAPMTATLREHRHR